MVAALSLLALLKSSLTNLSALQGNETATEIPHGVLMDDENTLKC